jgi:GNAT superfamily N-acetyltransferase
VGFEFYPATPGRWPDIERLFGNRGACGGCWCMSWRKPKREFESDKGARNREALRAIVAAGPPPGVLAYSGSEPIGWCAVAPRSVYVRLASSRVLKPIDDAPVWSVSCLFVAKPYRRQGLSADLLRAAADFVKTQGGTIVEGYPAAPKDYLPDAFVWTGLPGSFRAAGFRKTRGGSASRPIYRYDIR